MFYLSVTWSTRAFGKQIDWLIDWLIGVRFTCDVGYLCAEHTKKILASKRRYKRIMDFGLVLLTHWHSDKYNHMIISLWIIFRIHRQCTIVLALYTLDELIDGHKLTVQFYQAVRPVEPPQYAPAPCKWWLCGGRQAAARCERWHVNCWCWDTSYHHHHVY